MAAEVTNGSTILVVEDSSTQALRLQQLLSEGFPDRQVRVASNGREALEAIALQRPALVISDILMPVMDGYTMCRAIKTGESTRDIPVVLLTSLSDAEDIIRGLNAGTDYYLTKPYEEKFLLSNVGAILEGSKATEPDGKAGWKVNFGGRTHSVRADIQQMLNLLLSTYENAVHQNKQLRAVEEELRRTNENLEDRVGERTAELSHANERLTGEIGERCRAEDQLRVQLRRLDALRRIDTAITGSLDLRVTLDVLLDQVVTQLEVDAASVVLLRPHSQRLEVAASRGFRTRSRSEMSEPNLPAQRAARERTIVRIDNLAHAEHAPLGLELWKAERFHSYIAVPLIAKGQAEGVLEVYHRTPLAAAPEWMDFLEALAGQAAIAIDSALMFENVQRSNAELFNAYDATLAGWSHALDLRDKETEGHSLRVTEMTERISRHLGIGDAELIHTRRGALLHDIGKLGVPDEILRKPGPLTDEERTIMERHPVYAYEMLAPIGYLRPALHIPYAHHEKWDGTGYPRALRGEQIPEAARVFAVADVWDALRSDRSYRRAWSRKSALEFIRRGSGSHFDPRMVSAFESLCASLGEGIDPLPEGADASESELGKGRAS